MIEMNDPVHFGGTRSCADGTAASPIAGWTRESSLDFAQGGIHALAKTGDSERFTAFRKKRMPLIPISFSLGNRWIENAVPIFLLLIVGTFLSLSIDNFYSAGNLLTILQQAGEVGFVVLAMALVVVVGGIDLSVGGIFALCNFAALLFIQYLKWPVGFAIPAVLVLGGLLGGLNGYLIGYLRLRAFLTTLITLIIFRAIFDTLSNKYGGPITSQSSDSDFWNYLALGQIFGIGVPFWLCIAIAIGGHVFLTRLRPGWHIMAIGGSRRAAHNAGLPVARIVALCYLMSGILTAVSAVFYAARLGSLGAEVGRGLEFTVLTGVIAGGIRLGGGSGSVPRALMGLLIVFLITFGLTTMSVSAGIISVTLALTMIVASVLDNLLRIMRQRSGPAEKIAPDLLRLPSCPIIRTEAKSIFRPNDRLGGSEFLTLSPVDGPDDIAFDRAGNLYAGSRHGSITRFVAPDFRKSEAFAHIGSATMGMEFDADGDLYVCAGEMGLYRIAADGNAKKLTDQPGAPRTSKSIGKHRRFVDGICIAADGCFFFSENGSWSDLFTASNKGRILCFDPRSGTTRVILSGLNFPNGVCMGPDGQSILFSLTGSCSVQRYWFDGPKKGCTESMLMNLPGHPGNINRASDGSYWMSLVAGRSPAIDLAWSMPGFRKRMTTQLPKDEWMFPQMNVGGIVKFNAEGEILDVMWDTNGERLSSITSVREYDGYLYISSAMANRIHRLKLIQESATNRVSSFDVQEVR
jgi:ribose transport system permease protein